MPIDVSPILLSAKVAVIATIFVAVIGTTAAWLINRFKFPGKHVLETVIGLPLILPPTVVGFGLLLLFGKNGPLGTVLEIFHIRIVFTWWAAVITAVVVSLPLMYQNAKGAMEGVDVRLQQAARTLGSSEWRIFYTVILPLAWPGLIAGILLAFARALGEFGATMMLAGNIPGQTQTIPLAIYFAVESGDMHTAGYLVMIISFFAFIITYGLSKWVGKMPVLMVRRERDAGSSYQKSIT